MSLQPATTTGIIGSGNLAWSLAAALKTETFSVEQIISRNLKTARGIADEFGIPAVSNQVADIFPDLDLVFICVPDDHISEVAEQLKGRTGKHTYIVHCSGSASLDKLSSLGERRGVMWPMQTFSYGNTVDISEVSLFFEGTTESLSAIRAFAFALSKKVIFMESPQRERMHMAAVIGGNFVTWLMVEAERIAKANGAGDFSVFEPYLKEVMRKTFQSGPMSALTGPAKRGDTSTLERHMNILAEDGRDDLKALYRMLSDMIRKGVQAG